MTKNTTLSKFTDFLTVSEIKDYLKISQSMAYELTHDKSFPVCRVGGSIRVPRDAFFAWVDQRTSIPGSLSTYMSAQ